MNSRELQEYDKVLENFKKLKKLKKLGREEYEKLLSGVTELLGWYRINRPMAIRSLIMEMIELGEKNLWDMTGTKILLQKAEESKRIKIT